MSRGLCVIMEAMGQFGLEKSRAAQNRPEVGRGQAMVVRLLCCVGRLASGGDGYSTQTGGRATA